VFAGQVAAALQDAFESGDSGTAAGAAVLRACRVLAAMPGRSAS